MKRGRLPTGLVLKTRVPHCDGLCRRVSRVVRSLFHELVEASGIPLPAGLRHFDSCAPRFSMKSAEIAPPNAYRRLWAGFMAIMASGVGFSIRAGILGQWAEQYGFTQTELGAITGGGLTGFGIIILLSALIADKIGYVTLMVTAFVMHLASAALTLATGMAYASGGKPAAFLCLYWGMFLFAVGNGIAEAVVNPLVATIFPTQRTHYLNILHAGWPGGLIVGGLLYIAFTGESLFGWKPLAKALP